MAAISKYITKAEIIGWVNLQNTKITESDIPDDILDKAHVKTDATIVNKGCWDKEEGLPTEPDNPLFLKMATQCFCLALLCKAGVITQTSGEVLSNKFGDIEYKYQRTNPLFFFATGASEPFMDLLPYETLRMYAYSFLKAYCKYRFYIKTGYKKAKPRLVVDATSRGAYWNRPYTEHDIADSEYGELLPEETYL